MKHTPAEAEVIRERARKVIERHPDIPNTLPYLDAADKTERDLRCDHAKMYGFTGNEVGLFYSEVRKARDESK
jgi:hypothetical protein